MRRLGAVAWVLGQCISASRLLQEEGMSLVLPPSPPPAPPPPCKAAALDPELMSGEPVTLLVSYNFNEGMDWLVELVKLTSEAVQVPHLIVVSTRPDLYFQAADACVNFSHVHFSEPFFKGWGMDLLHGHVSNLQYALRKGLGFTHAIALASNNMFIRRVTRAWAGFSPHHNYSHVPEVGDLSIEEARARGDWHWPAILADEVLLAWMAKHNMTRLRACLHEGTFGSSAAWVQLVDFLTLDAFLAHNPPVWRGAGCCGQLSGYRYPAEEVVLPTLIHHLGLQRSMWVAAGPMFWQGVRPWEAYDVRCTLPYTLVAKRISREVGNPVIREIKANW